MTSPSDRVHPIYLKEIYEKVACASLNMHDPTHSSAEIFQWRGKAWIATGGLSSGKKGILSVAIREVVPEALWDQPYNGINARGRAFYLGGRFYPKGNRKETWVMTDNHLNFLPGPEVTMPLEQVRLF